MTTETKPQNIWDFLEFHNDTESQDLAELVNWSMNFDYKESPYLAFLDLIGYSQDTYGETQFDWQNNRMGYLELNYLADALKLYTSDPSGVIDWITELEGLEA
jgi:hypothetical protein